MPIFYLLFIVSLQKLAVNPYLKMQKMAMQEFDIICLLPGTIRPVMIMKYEDPNMEAYWNTLSPQVQAKIDDTGIELCSLGMLMKLGDYYQNSRERQAPGGDFHA